jgi:hypothetical protein
MTYIQGSVTRIEDDIGDLEGGLSFYDSPYMHWGWEKSGYKQHFQISFSNYFIPRGALVTSSTLVLYSYQTVGAGGVLIGSQIELLEKDAIWNAASTGPRWNMATTNNMSWKVKLLDGAATMAEVSAANAINSTHSITGTTGEKGMQVGQGVKITTGGTIDSVDASLGMPIAGTADPCWVELRNADGDLLATSNTRPTSDIAVKILAAVRPYYNFTFPVGQRIDADVDDIIVPNMNGTFVLGVGPELGAGGYSYPVSSGVMRTYGTGKGFDNQNYILVDDYQGVPYMGTPIPWTVFESVGYKSSPNLASLIQTWIDDPGYTGHLDGKIALRIKVLTAGANAANNIATFENPTWPSAVLGCTFTRRIPQTHLDRRR